MHPNPKGWLCYWYLTLRSCKNVSWQAVMCRDGYRVSESCARQCWCQARSCGLLHFCSVEVSIPFGMTALILALVWPRLLHHVLSSWPGSRTALQGCSGPRTKADISHVCTSCRACVESSLDNSCSSFFTSPQSRWEKICS